MAGAALRSFLLASAVVFPLHSDLTIRVRETYGATTATRTEYYQPPLWRSDREGGSQILDTRARRSFSIDTVHRKYTFHDLSSIPPAAKSDQTIVVDIETKDTGERRPMFGHTARHLVTTERRHNESPGQSPAAVTETTITDGWYLDIPGRYPGLSRVGTVAMLVVGDQQDHNTAPNIVVHAIGPRAEGLPVWEKTGGRLLEVTALSEAPLDPKLFEPPPGFRRVIQPLPGEPLSWTDRLFYAWQQFTDWLIRQA